MPPEPEAPSSIQRIVRQSPPIDLSKPIDESWVKNKTIVITGGASGLGEGFFKRWATAGACVIIGDILTDKGVMLVLNTIRETGNRDLHFVHCDVTSWSSQVDLFKTAVEKSPHGGIDCVVASAGIGDQVHEYENPQNLDASNPPEPNLAVMDVNLKGVMYTTHLALFWLPKNPTSPKASTDNVFTPLRGRDRHLLLLSSMAGLYPLPDQMQYTASKHALVGLYRTLRGTTFKHGIRVNMLCPYFIDTPIVDTGARVLLAGGNLGKVDTVVDAATRFVADPHIIGRALVVGPKLDVKQASEGNWVLADVPTGHRSEIVEVYAHDFEQVEVLVRRLIGVLNKLEEARGWPGYLSDLFSAACNVFWNRRTTQR